MKVQFFLNLKNLTVFNYKVVEKVTCWRNCSTICAVINTIEKKSLNLIRLEVFHDFQILMKPKTYNFICRLSNGFRIFLCFDLFLHKKIRFYTVYHYHIKLYNQMKESSQNISLFYFHNFT